MQKLNCEENMFNKGSTMKKYFIFKRIFDIVLSFVGLIICAPIIIIICFLVALESKGNPIFAQKRVGVNNKEFNMFKIRSMKFDAEKNGAQWAEENDPRITVIGRFIRKTRIDELPQLVNVIIGDMSIIGPRPEREVFYREFEKTIPKFRERLLVKPGITGYAQVNGGYNLKPKEKLELDLVYIYDWNLKMEFNIVFKTLKVIFTGEGAR